MIEPAVSPKRARYLRHVRRQSRRVRLWQLAILVGFFAFWELSCRVGLSDGFLVSSPSRIAATFLSLCRSGDVLLHELPLFSVRPTGDGQGEVPPRAVAQRQLHGDGHVLRQHFAAPAHIAEPDAPSVPGLL